MSYNSLVNKKFGADPGTIIYTGNRRDEKIKIEFYSYDEQEYHYEENVDLKNFQLEKEKVNWLNISGVHNVQLLKEMGKKFNIDDIILEDIANVNQRAKLERRVDFAYVVLRAYHQNPETGKMVSNQLSIIIGENYLLSFQDTDMDIFDFIRHRIREKLGLVRGKGADYLAYLMLDATVDNYFKLLENIEFEIDAMEEQLINYSDKNSLRKVFDLKQNFVMLKRAILPVREMVTKFDPRELKVLRPDLDIFVEDLHDHVIIVHEIMENISNRITGLIDLYHSSINNTMNETMRVLTIVSTIFVPLSFIAGLYGMNFEDIPETRFKYGYYVILTIMVTIAISMLRFFRKKKWI